MADWLLQSLDAFDEPISFHTNAQQLHDFHAGELLRRAQPLIDELRRGYPEQAMQFEQMVQALAQRLRDTAANHGKAVEYHTTHKHWHSSTEDLLRQHISAPGAEPPGSAQDE